MVSEVKDEGEECHNPSWEGVLIGQGGDERLQVSEVALLNTDNGDAFICCMVLHCQVVKGVWSCVLS